MDAMSGRGELRDRGLVADFYGLGKRAEYRTERTGANGADGADSIILDMADSIILDGADWAEYRTRRTGQNTGLGGLGQTGRTGRTGGLADWRMQRSAKSWTGRIGADGAKSWTGNLADVADYGILDGADRAD